MVMSHLKVEEEVLEENEWRVQLNVKVKVKVKVKVELKVKKLCQRFIKHNPMKACGRENL